MKVPRAINGAGGPGPIGELGDARIISLSATPIAIPLATPTRMATRLLTTREYVVVRLEASNGATGSGYTYAGTLGGRAVALFIADVISPRLVGADAFGPSRPWSSMYRDSLLVGRRGLALRALSAVDIALWDLLGRTLGAPLSVILGGVRDAVPAYASGGYYRPGDPIQNVTEELGRYLRLGFSDFKIKVGGAPFAVDVERVRAARDVIGSDRRLALDANNAWASVDDAVRFGRAVEPYDPWWLEEPLSPDDVPGHAEITRRLPFPVAMGEINATRWEFRDILAQRACSIIQPDAGVIGGISEWLKVAHAAEMFGVPVAPHWNANIHVHLVAAVEGCLNVEYFAPDEDIFNFEQLVTERLTPADGQIPVPVRPGHGIEWDEAAIRRYAMGSASN